MNQVGGLRREPLGQDERAAQDLPVELAGTDGLMHMAVRSVDAVCTSSHAVYQVAPVSIVLRVAASMVAAPSTYGCSPQHVWLQPPARMVAASSTYGCSL